MNATDSTVRVLFVCMGNICRSPTAHAVFDHKLRERGLEGTIAVDSAGTHGYHVGHPPDERAAEAAARRGYDLRNIRARQVSADDLASHDYVLAMDAVNRAVLEELAQGEAGARSEIELFLTYAADLPDREVPDPYYGARNGFEEVLDLVETGAEALLEELTRRHGLR